MEFCTQISNQLMLKEVEKGTGAHAQNIVSSPLSINVILNMVAAGSKGDTLDFMLGFLKSKDIDKINSKSVEMMEVAASGGGGGGGGGSSDNVEDGPIVAMINGAWVDERFPLKPDYAHLVKRIYKCEATNFDFGTEADQVVDEVNSWANTASRGLINNILQRESLSKDLSLILANGLYFQGLWDDRRKFEAWGTENRDFYLLNGDIVSVPFMTSGYRYHYESFDGFKVLKIPYQSRKPNKKFSMYFFLPNEHDGLQNLLEKFSSDSEFLQQQYFRLREVTLEEFWIPKFKFSFDFDVSSVMESMGASLSIVKNPEDMSNMMHVPDDVPFFILKMFQKSYIEIDEKGTKATSVTALRLYGGGGWSPPPEMPSFVADHPFMFMIKEERSGLVFFTGAVLNPIK